MSINHHELPALDNSWARSSFLWHI